MLLKDDNYILVILLQQNLYLYQEFYELKEKAKVKYLLSALVTSLLSIKCLSQTVNPVGKSFRNSNRH